MKLISMIDYVLQIDEIRPEVVNFSSITDIRNYQLNSYGKIITYANFIKQPLTLGMFIPCDEKGNVLENKSCDKSCSPSDFLEDGKCGKNGCYSESKKLDKAKENVLFDGFEIEYFNYGGDVNDKSSFQIISMDRKIQICIYKSKPNYFIWNNSENENHPTIENLVKYNLTLTESVIKKHNI